MGNVRISYQDGNDNGSVDATEIVEESNYYPFGLKHKGYNANVSSLGNSTAQKWKYNGMEHDESLGLETYDFGARNYDPALGRWMNIDPLAEQMRRHSPYNYAYSNPVAFVDPDGMLGQAAYAHTLGVSINVLGSMFTESEAAKEREQRQSIYSDVNNALADDGDDVAVAEEGCDDCTKCPETCNNEKEEDGDGSNEELLEVLAAAAVASQSDSPALGPGDILALLLIAKYVIDSSNPTSTIGMYHDADSYIPPPKTLPGFPGAVKVRRKNERARWHLPNGDIGEWDSQHGEVEIYDKTGKKHKGAYDPETGEKKKDPKPGRKTDKK